MIKDKFEIIKKYIEGKFVLDCGCVGSAESGVHTLKFLHKRLVENSKKVVGIDISETGLKKLKESGYNVIHGNIENININQKFDAVVAGDIIEHISNMGLFLDNMKRHLNPDGVLIIHTPNPFGITRFYHMLVKKYVEVNPDHVCYYDLMTIKQALKRHGYEVVEDHYVHGLNPPILKKIVINLFLLLSDGFADSFVVVAKPVKVYISVHD